MISLPGKSIAEQAAMRKEKAKAKKQKKTKPGYGG